MFHPCADHTASKFSRPTACCHSSALSILSAPMHRRGTWVVPYVLYFLGVVPFGFDAESMMACTTCCVVEVDLDIHMVGLSVKRVQACVPYVHSQGKETLPENRVRRLTISRDSQRGIYLNFLLMFTDIYCLFPGFLINECPSLHGKILSWNVLSKYALITT